MKIQSALLEMWLSEYKRVSYNLGESSVDNFTLGELLSLTGDRDAIDKLSLMNNDTHGSLRLREAIASLDKSVSPDDILVTAGTTEAILIYFQVRYRSGANVIVPVPTFHVLYETPAFFGYEVRYLQLRAENGFRIDPEELATLVDDNTQVIVLNTPQNPSGVVCSETEIQSIIEIAEKHNAEILVDEHYRFLPHDKDTEILPSLYGRSPKIISLSSTGKCFGCIGLRIGWLIANPEIIKACHFFKDYTTHTVCVLNDYIAAGVLLHRDKILPRYRQMIQQNINQFEIFIKQQPGLIGWIKPEAGTIAFPFFTDPNINSKTLAKRLVEDHGVLLLPGEAFDCPSHFRIALGVKPSLFQHALEKLAVMMETCL
ncbi:aminotransferase class I/II-fold pyridoxal phosphate-dependent enzyme [Nostoc sp.]|uniref:aminotransferase class I/II-fold pyridoxal phosphate-dependent enzyme n=1 Tax=Nostoc sp. TaxID=1180 RepID=UPI002FF913A8